MVTRIAITALASALLAACAVGPDHVRPNMQVAPTFGAAAQGTIVASTGMQPLADAEFWKTFGDATLDALVDDALLFNHDLRIALARYDRANALLRGAKFDALPTVTARADASESRASSDQAPAVPRDARDLRSYSAGINASWELDLFGRVRRGIEAGRAETAASSADLQSAQVAIVGEVARSYFELRGLQERLRVARDNAQTQRETLRLVEARFDAGRDSEFDTARARAQVASTDARIPALEGAASVAMHRIAVLTGSSPDALLATLSAHAPLPALPIAIDPGTPADLVRRRPDIAGAEQRLHAATARIGVATADLFPRLTLGGLIGSQAIDSSALFERGSETRLIALGIDWSFLDIGRVRARIAASDADASAALAAYQQAVLLALEDTENALVGHARAREQDVLLERAAIDSARAAELARTRFEAGGTGLLEVLDAERTRLLAQDAFADARTRSTTSAVTLFRALAGGWPDVVSQRERVAGR